jgi:hypothetical protein
MDGVSRGAPAKEVRSERPALSKHRARRRAPPEHLVELRRVATGRFVAFVDLSANLFAFTLCGSRFI